MAPTTTILVTGGNGTLGSAVTSRLAGEPVTVRTFSRSSGTHRGDLDSGMGLDAALDGVDTIIHCAAGKHHERETANLVDAAKRAGARHLVFISIAGIDQIPLPYYRAKLAAERAVETSGLPFTTLRTVQFHGLIATIFAAQRWSPVIVAPKVSFQPIDPKDVADRLVDIALASPAGRVPNLGGPEVRTARSLAEAYVAHWGWHRRLWSPSIPGATFAAISAGHNLVPDNPVRGRTFEEFLAGREPS